MTALLRTADLAVGHGKMTILNKINLTLNAGELVAIIGVNGSGKSTLLRTLTGLLEPASGVIAINGKDLNKMNAMERARNISVVLTGRPDMGLLDVRTLISLGRQPWTGHMGRLNKEDHDRINGAMHRTGTSTFEHRALRSLSDGELQLVLIARAMAQDTPIMHLDEPTAFLDLVNRVCITALLKEVAHRMDKLVLFSTHDLHTAMEMADRIILVSGGTITIATPSGLIATNVLEKAFSYHDTSGQHHQFDPGTLSYRVPDT